MRILHTADWHLGKLFYGNYLTEDQAYVLEQQLLPMIRDEGIDAVVLAGDVYDRSLPPAEAVELFDDVATRITADLHVPFLVISGNHDSPPVLCQPPPGAAGPLYGRRTGAPHGPGRPGR